MRKEIEAATAALLAALAADDPRVTEEWRFGSVKRFVKMLVLGKWIETGSRVEKAIDAHKAPPKPAAPNLRDI